MNMAFILRYAPAGDPPPVPAVFIWLNSIAGVACKTLLPDLWGEIPDGDQPSVPIV
jgi:hypothetical protein